MELQLDAGFLKLTELLQKTERKLLPVAHRRALQKTLSSLKVKARKTLQEQLHVPVALLKPRIKTKLSGNKSTGILWIGLAPIPVAKLGKPTQAKEGVVVAGRVYPHAFIATMRSQHQGVFIRKGKARLPIQQVMLPIAQIEPILKTTVQEEALALYEHYLMQAWDVLQKQKVK